MMTTLAIETATANRFHHASVLLEHSGKAQLVMLEEPNSQAAKLVGTIETALKNHDIWHSALSQLLITVGPGSFTGIRIGLAVARSIAFACPELKLIPITTFEALIASYQGDEGAVRCVMKAGKGDVYSQVFERSGGKWATKSDIILCKPEALPDDLPLFGNGIEGHDTEITAESAFLTLERVAIALREATPLYIRQPDAKLPTGT